jgi:hypothetical protein
VNDRFTLLPISSLIDAAAFVAHTLASGSGAVLGVDDARNFHDGLGIEGLPGDLIQLEGEGTPARILGVNYEANLLTLDRSLAWSAGQGVSLAYQGIGPDIGAYEEHLPFVLPPPRAGLPFEVR